MQNSILIYTDISQNVSNPYIVTPDDLKINDEFESNKKIISLLDKIELSSMNNKSFLSFFTYENSSLWWFMRPSIIMPLRTIINFIDRFEEVLDKQKPSEIKIQGDFSKFEIIKEICAKKNIKFSYSKIKYFSYQKKTSLKYKLQRERFKKIFFSKINKRIKVSQSRNNRNNLYDDSIIFAIPTGYRRSISLPNSTKTKGEFIQGNLISIMDELNEKTHCIDLDYTFQGEPDVLHERMAEGNWQPLEYFVTKKTNPNHTEFFKNYDNIIKNQQFQKKFVYSNVNLWSFLEDIFVTLSFEPHIPWYLKIMDSFSDFFSKNIPKAVFLPYEKGPLALAIMVSCKKHNIPTFGIQHGLWFEVHPDYSATVFRTSEQFLGMPLPDKMLVFGDYTKTLLMNQVNYPKEKITTLGNPAFFDLDVLLTEIKNQDLKSKFNLINNEKVILFTTGRNQKFYFKEIGKDYDERVLEHLLINLPSDKNLHVIIKPHPLEPNVTAYEKLIKKYGRKDFSIVQDSMYELLLLSDVMLTVYSTTLIDSITLGTPAIGIKFENSNYYSLLEDMHVAITSTLNYVSKNVLDLIFDNNQREQLFSQRKEFLKLVYNYPHENPSKQIAQLLKDRF